MLFVILNTVSNFRNGINIFEVSVQMKSWILECFPVAVYKRVSVLAAQACAYVFPHMTQFC